MSDKKQKVFDILHNIWYNSGGHCEKDLKYIFVPKIFKTFSPKIIYKCQYCGCSIIRPIKENEMIMQGATLCECGQKIIYFKVVLGG